MHNVFTKVCIHAARNTHTGNYMKALTKFFLFNSVFCLTFILKLRPQGTDSTRNRHITNKEA